MERIKESQLGKAAPLGSRLLRYYIMSTRCGPAAPIIESRKGTIAAGDRISGCEFLWSNVSAMQHGFGVQ